MAESPIIKGNNIISFTITSNGSEVPDTYGVMSISISQEVNVIASAQISIRDGNPSDQLFKITDSDTFEPGSEIEISLGYNNKDTKIFSGVVIKQSIKIDDSGTSLQVACKDTILKATKSKSKVVLTKAIDSKAIEQIADNLGIKKEVTPSSVIQDKIVQYTATDWDFIVNKAELNGMVVITDMGKLVVSPPPIDTTPEIGLKLGRDILEMDTEIEATNQYESITGSYWDPDSQELVSVEADDVSENEQGDLSGSELEGVLSADQTLDTSVPISQEATQAWVDAAKLKNELSRYRGNITFQGSALIKPNSLILLEGLGDRFNGNAYVSSVSHSMSDGQWRTEIGIGLSPDWFSEKTSSSMGPTASGSLKGVKGLQTAIVKSIYETPSSDNEDQEKEFKVELEIPAINNESETVWARLSTFYASSGVGAFFYPEEGDEVIIGFMDGDPRFPIIIGSVYSSKNAPPVTIGDDNNYIKTLMTKSQLEIQFDDENIVMTMMTPNKNIITISDKDEGITIVDENSNSIQMNDKGITIQSDSSLTIKATNDLTIQGNSVTIKADKTVSISGNSGCTMSSSGGNTSISGTMVNLN
ncbi:type VI secretion system tip protein VgrG [Flavivirga aquimarina]|uniref:Type VI secretion system tip protein VgrG n=1 Tax=Flavivirga aquimarina TaxID=2027862 RepID=A0ABT8W772_9FLAO|nr:type VI secretion system tip protein VgrG [Flavivirga aquimarina]MDO5968963.1 type VI secretion system tip protein VgrG [Flavivirga aquimarina]